MDAKKRILLKITGQIFLSENKKILDNKKIKALAKQIQQLKTTHQFCIVIGGGNFFRGSIQGTALQLESSTGHQIGMLATMMNGLILKDILEKESIKTALFSAVFAPEIIAPLRQEHIDVALDSGKTIIFSGGTGVPFFTTDTNAIVRALQTKADEVWKGTDVDGIYNVDPHKSSNATLIKSMNYTNALKKNIEVMDSAAFALASQHKLVIRIFNIFKDNALKLAATQENFGSKIHEQKTNILRMSL